MALIIWYDFSFRKLRQNVNIDSRTQVSLCKAFLFQTVRWCRWFLCMKHQTNSMHHLMFKLCAHCSQGTCYQCPEWSTLMNTCPQINRWRHCAVFQPVSPALVASWGAVLMVWSPPISRSMSLRSSRSSLMMVMRWWRPCCCCFRCCNTHTHTHKYT